MLQLILSIDSREVETSIRTLLDIKEDNLILEQHFNFYIYIYIYICQSVNQSIFVISFKVNVISINIFSNKLNLSVKFNMFS